MAEARAGGLESRSRFNPPVVSMSAEMEWVVRRSLGPADEGYERKVNPAKAITLAENLKLGNRIIRRTPRVLLTTELGEEQAERFLAVQRVVMAAQMQFEATSMMVGRVAAELGITVIFLKGMGLRLSGAVNPQDRVTIDVDVLTRADDCAVLQAALITRGFQEEGNTPDDKQHLNPLVHPSWRRVEIHRYVAGMSVTPGRSITTAGELAEHGLLVELPKISETSFAPRLDFILAHQGVHCLVQHPHQESYFFRFLCDLQSQKIGGEDGSDLLSSMNRWVSWILEERELEDLGRLVRELGEGRKPGELMSGEGVGEHIFRHFVAMSHDLEYKRIEELRENLVQKQRYDFSQTKIRRFQLWWRPSELARALGDEVTLRQAVLWNLARPFRLVLRYLPLATTVFRPHGK